MKIILQFLTIFLILPAFASGQDKVIPNKPYSSLNSGPGYITHNELTTGFGPGDVSVLYSKSFFGFNTIHGYQVNKQFVFAGGTGISFYNGGTLIPLFMDIRYRLKARLLTPYLYGDGGLLLNPKGGSKMFINPGAGVRYNLNKNLGLTLGAGFWMQMGETRDSFVNVKAGITFKPKSGDRREARLRYPSTSSGLASAGKT